ncbi:DMT family transporter [Robertkochia aurantiaca]|uniref:DMT family transporter n=1 Tax=Robertkochia aurantiaca TaxID=2873700 RepID=UPI001CCB3B8A|nr:EamA family transporter [Robertkochia sp. 3YJGBD-33]
MEEEKKKWIYLIILSLVWGSSYILIKKGLQGLSPLQLGSVRILFSTVFLFIIGFRSIRGLSKTDWRWIALSALCGTFLPVFLFAFAETEIDSSIASVLNSLVPLFTIMIGFVIFGIRFSKSQLIGVLLGLAGALILILQGSRVNPGQNYFYALLVVTAAILYAANANIIKSRLQNVSAMAIAVGTFALMVIPACIILFFSGISDPQVTSSPDFIPSLLYVLLLAVVGTGIAKIMFNKLVQISSAVFSTQVTYLIPVVGIFWGLLDQERFTMVQVLGSAVILFGVYQVNRGR